MGCSKGIIALGKLAKLNVEPSRRNDNCIKSLRHKLCAAGGAEALVTGINSEVKVANCGCCSGGLRSQWR